MFKILPAKTGDLYWVRVYSGTLKANSRVYNPQRDKRENVAQLWQIHATRKERDGQVERVTAGDIVGVIGPRHSITGDTPWMPASCGTGVRGMSPTGGVSGSVEPGMVS